MARSTPARIAMFGAGASLLVWSGRESYAKDPPQWEVRMFRSVNAFTDGLRRPAWIVMLGGTFGAVPAAAAVAWLTRHRRLAVDLATGGTAAYVLAKAVKPYVGRARPGILLQDVLFRDRIGGDRGWISGHTAVTTTLALVAGPSLGRGARIACYSWAAAVGVGRVYAGAHMPLDVAGGAGLGMILGAVFEPDVLEPDD